MSAELAPLPGTQVIAEQPVNLPANDDAALGAVWDKIERDNGAERDNGKFISPDPDKRAEPGPAGVQPGEDDGEGGISPPAAVAAVPLPANWRGMEATWEKIPAELRGEIATKAQELHNTVSEQGRQLSSVKPIVDVIAKNQEYFDGRYKMPDGSGLTPAAAVSFLFNAQRELDKNPIAGLLAIADRYGVRDQLATAFGKTVPEGESELRKEIAGLKQMLSGQLTNPASIGDIVSQKLQEKAESDKAEEEVSRLSKDKPFFSEIPEKRMVLFINDAWDRLGNTAAKAAVFDLAYDMAVNADPDLRAKAAAAKAAAAGHDPKKVADAKRAADVNIKSTSSGKGRELTDEEELGLVYDRNRKG